MATSNATDTTIGKPEPEGDGCEREREVANHPAAMGDNVSGANSSVGAEPRVQPRNSEPSEAKAGSETAKCMEGHEQTRQTANQDADAKVKPTQPTVQGWTCGTHPCRELEGSERERDHRGKDVCVDARAMGFECGTHVRVERRTERKEPIDGNGIGRDAE
jgi:hypothetical protein